MKKVALSVLLMIGLAVANEANTTAPAAEANATAAKATEAAAAPAAGGADLEKGKALYAKCAGCHGKDGKMKALGASEPIAGWDVAKTVEALKGYKAGTLNIHGKGMIMKSQANMSEEDMKAVAAYIQSLGK